MSHAEIEGRAPGAQFDLLAAAQDPHVRLFYEYWLSKLGPGGALPGRQHIDPGEMRAFLPHVLLLDVERLTGRYRYRHRLVGTHIVDLFGAELTGSYVDQGALATSYPLIYERLSRVVETGRPVYGVEPVPISHREFIQFEHLTVPLARDGTTVDMLLGIRCGLTAAEHFTSLI